LTAKNSDFVEIDKLFLLNLYSFRSKFKNFVTKDSGTRGLG